MIRFFNLEQWRLYLVGLCSPILGYYTPTKGFVLGLIVMFSFNIWAGMRVDGVSIVQVNRFSFRKFKNALAELLLYLLIVETIFTIMSVSGDKDIAVLAVKSLTYVFMYCYLQNSFRNLIIAYPKNTSLKIIYHIIRLEFMQLIPNYLHPIIDKFNNSNNTDKEDEENEK